MSDRELVYAIAADRFLEQQEHGWQCEACDDEQKARTKCKVCGKPYEEKQADGSVKRYTGTDVFGEIARMTRGR